VKLVAARMIIFFALPFVCGNYLSCLLAELFLLLEQFFHSIKSNHFFMYTLGINAAFHDSSACIIKDGQLIAASEEERFTQIKHGERPIPFSTYELPFNAIDYCLKMANVHLKEVNHVAYSLDPYLLLGDEKGKSKIEIPLEPVMEGSPSKWTSPWDPLFLSSIVNAPGQLVDGYPHHLQKQFKRTKTTDFKWHFVEHHIAH